MEDANYGYIYDLEGNLTTRFVDSIDNGVFDPGEDYTVYTWDYRNRLTQVKDFNGTTLEENTKYRYNADDQQVEREAFIGAFQTAHEHYVYDGAQRVLALDPDGDLKHRTTWGPGVDQLLVDEVFDSSTNLVEETLWAANDHLGSVNQLVDNSGTVVEHREYDSFGAIDKVFDEAGSKVFDKTDPAANLNVLQSTIAFAGREIDVASGLYYNRARWYDSASGRFISVDPAEDGNNWYAYAGSDPINFKDPTGFSAQHPLDVFAGAHGSGVTRPPNENIVSGAVANAARTIGNFIADTAGDAFRSFNPLASAAFDAGVGLATSSVATIQPILTGGSSNIISRFLNFRNQNLQRREQEFLQRQHQVALADAARSNAFGKAAARAADQAFDQQMRQPGFTLGPELLSATMQRLENDVMLGTTGLTRQETALGTVNTIFSLTGQETIGINDPLTSEPGFRMIESGVGVAFNPLNFTPIIATQGTRLGALSLLDDVPTGSSSPLRIDPFTGKRVQGISGGTNDLAFRRPSDVGLDLTRIGKSSGRLGREGEALATRITGAPQNTQSFVVNGRTRIPDRVLAVNIQTRQPSILGEVKNLDKTKQSLSRQLLDNVDLVGPGGEVRVFLPPTAQVTGPLQRAFDSPLNPLRRVDLIEP